MQTQNLQIVPKGVKPIIRASQSDVGRTFQLHLYDGATEYTPPTGTTLRLDGIKPDKTAFSYTDNLTLSGSVITVTCKTQMTLIPGTVQCEIRMTKGSEDIGTINFDLMVEKSPINGTTDLSQTEVPALVTLARVEMENAEAWAAGTKDGVPVGPDDPQYHNNAKYWAEQISGDGQEAEAWAVGTKSGVPVPSTDPQYHNNAKYYAQEAGSSATTAGTAATNASSSAQSASTSASAAGTSASNAAAAASRAEAAVVHGPYIGANGNWYVYDFTTQQYTDTNVKAQGPQGPQGIQGLPGEDGTNGTDGVGIVSITKTATQGLVDTYTVLLTNGQTYTFTVTNGQNGTGSGDMLAANYDPTQAVYNAGGIVAYVAAQLAGFSTSLSGLDDVTLSSLATGQSLFYDATAHKWVNRKIDYSDIQNTPTLGTAAAKNSTNAVTPNSTALVESGAVSAEIQTLTNEVKGNWSEGGTNLLPPILYNNAASITYIGVTLTIDDLKFKMTGTASGDGGRLNLRTDPFILKAGTYTVSGVIGAATAVHKASDNTIIISRVTPNEYATFTLESDTAVFVGINVANGVTYNETVGLQIEKGSSATPYVPYAKTNRELTAENEALVQNINDKFVFDAVVTSVNVATLVTDTLANVGTKFYAALNALKSALASDEIIELTSFSVSGFGILQISNSSDGIITSTSTLLSGYHFTSMDSEASKFNIRELSLGNGAGNASLTTIATGTPSGTINRVYYDGTHIFGGTNNYLNYRKYKKTSVI